MAAGLRQLLRRRRSVHILSYLGNLRSGVLDVSTLQELDKDKDQKLDYREFAALFQPLWLAHEFWPVADTNWKGLAEKSEYLCLSISIYVHISISI